jgi:hypothetical protein
MSWKYYLAATAGIFVLFKSYKYYFKNSEEKEIKKEGTKKDTLPIQPEKEIQENLTKEIISSTKEIEEIEEIPNKKSTSKSKKNLKKRIKKNEKKENQKSMKEPIQTIKKEFSLNFFKVNKKSITLMIPKYLHKHLKKNQKILSSSFGCNFDISGRNDDIILYGNNEENRFKTAKEIENILMKVNWEFIDGEWVETDRIFKEESARISEIPKKYRIFKRRFPF